MCAVVKQWGRHCSGCKTVDRLDLFRLLWSNRKPQSSTLDGPNFSAIVRACNREFIDWYRSEPRLAFHMTVVTR